MERVTIRILGLCDGTPTAFDGKYLVDYDPSRKGIDPEGYALTAHIAVTDDPQKARAFLSPEEALSTYQRSHGYRLDGQPNRPLTAFHVEIAPSHSSTLVIPKPGKKPNEEDD